MGKVYPIKEVIPTFMEHDPGKHLRGYRYREGLSYEELSSKTNISALDIKKMERNELTISSANAQAFGEALNVDYNRFL